MGDKSRSQTQSPISRESIYRNNHSVDATTLNVTGAHVDDGNAKAHTKDEVPETKDIALPYHNEPVNHVSLDIGGSLSKFVYFTKDGANGGGRLNFYKVDSSRIDELIGFIKSVLVKHYDYDPDLVPEGAESDKVVIVATGGGAFKFNQQLRMRLKCRIQKEDELHCLIVGLDFFITEIPNEIFVYDSSDPEVFLNENLDPDADKESIYPYLLVNIGSGCSMIKVTGPGPENFVRVGGSSLGGGTLWGLLSLLTSANDFDEMLSMAEKGDNETVDLLVGDIYGMGSHNKIGLKDNHIASSFGKVFKKVFNEEDPAIESQQHQQHNNADARLARIAQFREEDISRSLLYAVSNNIGQISYLQAQRYNLKKIYFAGSYISGHAQTIHTLSYAINFWSNGTKRAYFLKHEGYLGSMGAFLQKKFHNGETE
ncbi:unnamed protein product [Kuraishia capsulata CBS 1993]|uniref:Pantothenate kinase n=1 Tax=Kuraishia capsulata CBS 1993 TaxID=1382522 RepID=W6MW55_9ASCO|nr:uncharacterized protein KUCA_T00002880001 [Kuraishia capsulata CBS 1993]CDK26905.1 unnamed protein product [Kuraishia capsulata CBS 1993]